MIPGVRCALRGHAVVLLQVLVVWAVLMVVLLPWLRYAPWDMINDDALITLTYAKSMAEGQGFVFNTAPATLGTTSPLLAVSVGVLGRALHAVPVNQLGVIFGLACWAALLALLQIFHKTLRLARWEAVVLAVMLAAHEHFYPGGEVLLFQLLLTLTIILHLRGHAFYAGLTLAYLFLARGEGALLAPVLALVTAFRTNWRDPAARKRALFEGLQLAGGFVIVLGAWCLFAYRTFGAILPNTLAAKMLQARMGFASESGLFQDALIRESFNWDINAFQAYPALRVVAWGFAAVGVAAAFWRREGFFMVLFTWIALYVAAYTLLRVPGYAVWYVLPVFWMWRYAEARGLLAAMRWLRARRWPHPAFPRGLATLGAGALLGTYVIGAATTMVEQEGDTRADAYLAICDWLKDLQKPKSIVASGEVGYVGYFTEQPIVDLMGLVTPGVLPYVADGDYVGLIDHFRPAVIVEPDVKADKIEPAQGVAGILFTLRKVVYAPRRDSYYLVYANSSIPKPGEPRKRNPQLLWSGGGGL